jgi:hypothetical protein
MTIGSAMAPVCTRPNIASRSVSSMNVHHTTRSELDSHANTCCFGTNAYVLSETMRTVDVLSFISDLGAVAEVPICTCAVAYDDPRTYTTMILVFHQALYFGERLPHNLICPFQLRMNGIKVDECPRFLNDDRDDQSHSIYSPSEDFVLPLTLDGVISYFPSRKPTEKELQTCHRIVLTYDSPEWDLYAEDFRTQEETFHPSADAFSYENDGRDYSLVSAVLASVSTAASEDSFVYALRRSVNIDAPKMRYILASKTGNRKGAVTPERLAVIWNIGLEQAKRTIERTTQRGVRDFTNPKMNRRLKPLSYQLMFKQLRTTLYTDTFFSKIKSLQQHTCAQVFCSPVDWTRVYPLKSKGDAHMALDLLHRQHGVPAKLICDNANELTKGNFRKKALAAGSHCMSVEAYTQEHNRAELAIRELKRGYRRQMRKSNAPRVLWDHCLELQGLIRSHTALDLYDLQGDVPETHLTGDTPDISPIVEHAWYDWVWFLSPAREDMEIRELGHWLGPSHDVGQAMCAKILSKTAQIVCRTSVFPLSVEDANSEVVAKLKDEFNTAVNAKLKEKASGVHFEDDDDDIDFETPEFEAYGDDDIGEEPTMPEADEFDHDAFDKYVAAEVVIPKGDSLLYGKVLRRKRDNDGNLIGHAHANPVLDSSIYEVEFEDGRTEAYAANAIAEYLYAQVDDQGYQYLIIDEIIDHKKDGTALAADDGFVTVNGRRCPRRTTKGWKLCVQWKDGSTSWEALKDLKESNPIEVAEYAVANKLVHEPAFAWWVSYTIKKRDRIIKANHTRYLKRTHKFGIEMPKNIERALEIDRETGTTFWRDAIAKEMRTKMPAFKFCGDGAAQPIGYTPITGHLIFDVKMDFTRKARFVADGHLTDPPASSTYASVVSRESVRIAFLLAALNDLDILSADISGAYLNAPCREKICIFCGPEFGSYQGQWAIIEKALYGLKSSGAAWRHHFAAVLREMGFDSCLADPDAWLRPAVKSDGSKYYEYLLVYTDDILSLSVDPKAILTMIDQHFKLKPESVGVPTTYLGATISKFRLPDDPDKERWAMSSEQYVKEAVANVELWLKERDAKLKTKAPSVLPSGYRPELDASPELDDDDAGYYASVIGVLVWAVEFGRIDIATEVSMMSAFRAVPRQGHLDAVFHMFSYLKSHDRSRLVFDDSYVQFTDYVESDDWKDFYGDVKEAIPPNAPEPRGKPVQMTAFIDSDHAGDLLTRRSRTGVFIYLNRAPIIWHSKKQNSVETSAFGSEFVGLKTGVELIKGARYKLRMMGVPLDGPANVRVDNMSVVYNTTRPESTLKKKSNSIAYHFVRENVANGTLRVAYENTLTNLADCLTKTQSGPIRQRITSKILW